MSHHRESLNRILKKLEVARDANINVSQLDGVKDTMAASIYLAIANVFQTSMGFVDTELEKLDKLKKPKKSDKSKDTSWA